MAAISWATLSLVDRLTERWFIRDLEIRSGLLANTLRQPLLDAIVKSDKKLMRTQMTNLFRDIIKDERLFALAYCNGGESVVVSASAFSFTCGKNLLSHRVVQQNC